MTPSRTTLSRSCFIAVADVLITACGMMVWLRPRSTDLKDSPAEESRAEPAGSSARVVAGRSLALAALREGRFDQAIEFFRGLPERDWQADDGTSAPTVASVHRSIRVRRNDCQMLYCTGVPYPLRDRGSIANLFSARLSGTSLVQRTGGRRERPPCHRTSIGARHTRSLRTSGDGIGRWVIIYVS
jgi:hypothetical protein